MTAPGLFITFEGIDGAGKSTQIDRLRNKLESEGKRVVLTREPGGTPVGEKIRTLLLSDDMTPRTETLLFFAGRAEHAETKIRPALETGAWVLSDRFTDATYAYQVGGKGFPGEEVEALECWTLGDFRPSGTVLFDLDPEIAAQRRAKRADGAPADRFEAESTRFFTKVREAYLSRARRDPERFLIVDALASVDVIAAQIAEWVDALEARQTSIRKGA